MISFAHPIWLFAGAATCVGLILLLIAQERTRRDNLAKCVAPQLIGKLTANLSTVRRKIKQVILLIAMGCLFAALARPQYGFKWVDVKRKGIDLLIALDVSKSMLAEDIRPNRLQRAHFAILDFVDKLGGDRVGLMPFAGTSYLMCPMTTDYEAFEQSLNAVNTDIIPVGGTNIGELIENADKILSKSTNHKILIILTDGENLQGDALASATKAAENKLTVYTVGVGTPQGELIPLGDRGTKGFIKDDSGQFVTSKLDEKTLATIAEKTGGIYARLGDSGEGLESIYQQKLKLVPKEDLIEKRHQVPIERYHWPLAVGLLLLMTEMLIGERKFRRRLVSFGKNRKFWLKKSSAVVIALLLLGRPMASSASPGEDAYQKQDYLGASQYYAKRLEKRPEDPQLNYNYGTAAYRNNLFDEAIKSFSKALGSDDPALQQKSYFNLGNSHYRKGEESLKTNPQLTAEQWQQAIDAFRSAGQLAPKDERPKNNQALVEKQLEELKKQLKDQKQKNDQQDKKDSQQKKEQDSKADHSQGNQQQESGKQNSTQQSQDDSKQSEQSASGNQQQDKQTGTAGSSQDERKPGDSQDKVTPQPKPEQQPAGTAGDKSSDKKQQLGVNSQDSEVKEADEGKKATIGQLNKMTKEEAEQLLNGLQGEEGRLNFAPSKNSQNDKIDRDW